MQNIVLIVMLLVFAGVERMSCDKVTNNPDFIMYRCVKRKNHKGRCLAHITIEWN